jgi:hypothetical protein
MRIVLHALLLLGLFFFARWFMGIGLGGPYIPVRKRDIADALDLISLSPQDVAIDLGSGDGRILRAAVESGARVVGYELNPFLVWFSRFRLRMFKDRARIYRKNLLQADLHEVTIIFSFQITSLMPKIAHMIHERAKPGTKLLSFAFDVPGMKPVAQKGIVKLYTI